MWKPGGCARLEEYYEGAGQTETVRIGFPKGSYIPVIHPAVVLAAPGKSPWPWILGTVVFVVLLTGVGLAGYRLRQPSTSTIVAVAPSGWLWGETADAVRLEESLAERVGMELARRRVARVVGWPLMLPYRTGRPDFRRMQAGLGATKMLLIRVRDGGAAVFLLSAASNEKIWVGEYSARDNEAELARNIAKDFATKQGQGEERHVRTPGPSILAILLQYRGYDLPHTREHRRESLGHWFGRIPYRLAGR